MDTIEKRDVHIALRESLREIHGLSDVFAKVKKRLIQTVIYSDLSYEYSDKMLEISVELDRSIDQITKIEWDIKRLVSG